MRRLQAPSTASARPSAYALAALLSAWAPALACAHAPSPPCSQVGEFAGTEDFDRAVIDGRSVLMVSATARREGESDVDDGIWEVDWGTKEGRKLALLGRDGCSFAPHGISTVEVEPGRWELWAINHHREVDRERGGCEGLGHSVEHFRIEAEGLRFVERLSGPSLTNPNDLDVLADGRFWMSNNPPWDEEGGLVGDLLLGRAKGQVLRYDPAAGAFSVAAEGLVFPNGIAVVEGALWVSAAKGRLFRMGLEEDGSVTGEPALYRAQPKATLDNIMEVDGSLWLTGHPKGLKFIRHSKRSKASAPTVAYRLDLDPEGGELRAVAHWRRGEANAGATVLPVDDALVVGLVFDRGLRVCEPGE